MALVEVSQFEGSLLGGLIGDCLGDPFANDKGHAFSQEVIEEYFDCLLAEPNVFSTIITTLRRALELSGLFTRKSQTPTFKFGKAMKYTDDTAMAISIAESLIHSKTTDDIDVKDLAKRFTEEYFLKDRGYGFHVRLVFTKLKGTNYEDVFKPASEQFDGTGSMGNGSGMRVAPIGLFTIRDTDLTRFTLMAVRSSRITHTHPNGIVGGIFQALAVRHGLLFGQKRKEESTVVDPVQILDAFEKDFEFLAKGNVALPSGVPSFESGYADYLAKLKVIRKLLADGNEKLEVSSVKSSLGVAVTAAESIPTAFFCFLAAFKDIPFVKADTQFQRTIQLAVYLGGDTDTIASMAGAIAGGFLGRSEIPDQFVKICEDFEGVTDLSKKLYAKTV